MRRTHPLAIVLATVPFLFFCVPQSQAGMLTYSFSGSVDSVSNLTGVGSTFSGSFSYDTATANSSGSPVLGSYLGTASLDVTAGSFVFGNDTDLGSVLVGNSFPSGPDQFSISLVDSTPPTVSGTAAVEKIQLHVDLLDHFNGNAITSTALPSDLNAGDFDYRRFSITGYNPSPTGSGYVSSWDWNGTINEITLQTPSVPEPTSIALFAVGSLGLGLFSRRKRQRVMT